VSSLFGHLAPRFASNPEDVATEALCYILRRSPAARQEFIHHLKDVSDVEFSSDLQFSTHKRTDDGGVPDLWGQARDQRVLVESKFWAGLTRRQSAGYQEGLSGVKQGACIFLVPEERVDNVERKINSFGDSDKQEDAVVSVTNWTAVLDTLESSIQNSGEEDRHQILGDLQQLRGLCERLKAEGFHPIRAEELGPDVARRQLDLRKLVEEMRETLMTERFDPWTVTSNMRRRTSVYRFKGQLYGTTFFLGILFNLWRDLEDSPLWVKFREQDLSRRKKIREVLHGTATVLDHPRKERDLLIPLELKIGASRDEVLDHLKKQVQTISGAMSSLPVQH